MGPVLSRPAHFQKVVFDWWAVVNLSFLRGDPPGPLANGPFRDRIFFSVLRKSPGQGKFNLARGVAVTAEFLTFAFVRGVVGFFSDSCLHWGPPRWAGRGISFQMVPPMPEDCNRTRFRYSGRSGEIPGLLGYLVRPVPRLLSRLPCLSVRAEEPEAWSTQKQVLRRTG